MPDYMSTGKLSFIAIFLVLLLLATFGFLWWDRQSDQAGVKKSEPVIISLVVDKPNLLVRGQYLDEVEIYAVPTGTGVDKSDAVLFGKAIKQDSNNNVDNWILPIPDEPVLASEIFAKGFANDQEVGSVSLRTVGATGIYNALWSARDSMLVPLEVGQTGTLANISIRLIEIVEDSRCPVQVTCIQAGDLRVAINLISDGVEDTFIIGENDKALTFGGYLIDIADASPDPIEGQETSDYLITFSVAREIKS